MIYKDIDVALLSAFLFLILISLVFYLIKAKNESKKLVLIDIEATSGQRIIKCFKGLFYVFLVLGFAFLFFALSRPQSKKVEPQEKGKGIDIVFSLDISDSMLIEDMMPLENRLESAKHHIKEFITKRDQDRLGLVVFSGEAYTRVPLTVDHGLLVENLKDVAVSEYMKKGTAIGVALAAAVNRIKNTDSKSKVIILLTDGENNTGVIDPLTALDLTVDLGARVYTIGIGRDGRSMLPVFSKDRFGRKVKSYRPFPTKINEKLLRKISYKTGGQFYRASEESDLSRIFEDIDQLEKSSIKLPDRYVVVEKFQKPLKWALLFFFLSFLIEVLFLWEGV